MRRFLLMVSCVILLTATLVPDAAQAARWSSPDPHGDVDGSSPPPPPAPGDEGCGEATPLDATGVADVDVTGLGVVHSRDTVTVTVRLDHVDRGDLWIEVPLLAPAGDFTVSVDRQGRHTYVDWEPGFQTAVAEAQEHAGPDACSFYVVAGDGHCQGLSADVSDVHDRVVLSIPRRCLKDPRWVRAGASTSVFDDLGDDDPDTYALYDDHWTPPSRPHAGYPVYGQRVRPPAVKPHR